MTQERKDAFKKVKELISLKQEFFLNNFPIIHEIEDGLIIRFFTTWEDSKIYPGVKIRRIENKAINKNEKILLSFIPKGTIFDSHSHNFKECFICLDGEMDIKIDDQMHILENFSKLTIDKNITHSAIAVKDTYLIVICKYDAI